MAATKGVPILISLDAQATAEGQTEEPMRLITTGELFQKPEETVIRYEESLDENEPPQKIELTIRDGSVTMSRNGAYDTKLVFEKGKRYESQYRTPYGVMDMALFCTRASFAQDREGGELTLQYQLDLAGQFAAVHDMHLHFMRKKDAG
ncbi:MAG: DUF1934 domain-containing protein [Candidatus Limiplasma sp.]|nr:DUF1934 domain-containing protein [Candidatus Limiplasma sp.]